MRRTTHARRRALTVLALLVAFLAPASIAHALWSTTATGALSVSTAAPTPPPAAPTNLVCTSMNAGSDLAAFGWTAVPGATSYNLYQRSGPSNFVLKRSGLTGTSVSGITRNEGPGPDDNTQVIALRAVGPGGESANSNQVTVDFNVTNSCGQPPRPSNFRCGNSVSGNPPGRIVLWNPVTSVTEYRIYAGTSINNMSLLVSGIPGTATSWTLNRDQFSSGNTGIVIRAVRGTAESSVSENDALVIERSGTTGFGCSALDDD